MKRKQKYLKEHKKEIAHQSAVYCKRVTWFKLSREKSWKYYHFRDAGVECRRNFICIHIYSESIDERTSWWMNNLFVWNVLEFDAIKSSCRVEKVHGNSSLAKCRKKRSRVMVLQQCSASVARLALQLLTTIKSGCHPAIRAAKKRLHATHMQVWRTDFDSNVFKFFASTHAKLYSPCQIFDSLFEESSFLL